MSKAVIIPTGDEIRDGIVLDTDSGVVMTALLRLDPCMEVLRLAPVQDLEDRITDTIRVQIAAGYDYIILIGGSGGGHRFSPTLGKDYTHTALDELLTDKYTAEIYGKNGHLWCRLLLGHAGNSLVFNLPGPRREAEAAIRAFAEGRSRNLSEDRILKDMQQAVMALYGDVTHVEHLL